MSSIISKMNEKRCEIIKKEYKPNQLDYSGWLMIIGIVFALGVNGILYYIFKEITIFSYVAVLLGMAAILLAMYLMFTDSKTLFTLTEVVVGKLVCYEYKYKDKKTNRQTKKVFESFSDAEMFIENLKEKKEELKLEPVP